MNIVSQAALMTAAQSEWFKLSRNAQQDLLADFELAIAEDGIGAIEYMRRIGSGNLQSYANVLAAGHRRKAQQQASK